MIANSVKVIKCIILIGNSLFKIFTFEKTIALYVTFFNIFINKSSIFCYFKMKIKKNYKILLFTLKFILNNIYLPFFMLGLLLLFYKGL